MLWMCIRFASPGERRIEVFVKIHKTIWGGQVGGSGRGWGVRLDVNEELKFL